MSREYCILYIGARDLAMDRGLKMPLTCPLEETCQGEVCVYIDPDRKVKEDLKRLRDELNRQEPIIGC
jgi:hypothetical protein